MKVRKHCLLPIYTGLNIHYHSKGEERKHKEEILEKSKIKSTRQTTNPKVLCLMLKGLGSLSHPALMIAIFFFSFLVWFHTLWAVFFDRYPTSVEPPTSWVLYNNLDFTFIASHNILSWHLCMDFPAT